MGGEDPAGSPEWSWNAAWDECHGVEREVRERRCVVCSVAEGCFVRVRTEFVTASQSQRSIRLRAPPQGRWHIVTVKQSRGSAAMTCNGY